MSGLLATVAVFALYLVILLPLALLRWKPGWAPGVMAIYASIVAALAAYWMA